jgi:protein TonB
MTGKPPLILTLPATTGESAGGAAAGLWLKHQVSIGLSLALHGALAVAFGWSVLAAGQGDLSNPASVAIEVELVSLAEPMPAALEAKGRDDGDSNPVTETAEVLEEAQPVEEASEPPVPATQARPEPPRQLAAFTPPPQTLAAPRPEEVAALPPPLAGGSPAPLPADFPPRATAMTQPAKPSVPALAMPEQRPRIDVTPPERPRTLARILVPVPASKPDLAKQPTRARPEAKTKTKTKPGSGSKTRARSKPGKKEPAGQSRLGKPTGKAKTSQTGGKPKTFRAGAGEYRNALARHIQRARPASSAKGTVRLSVTISRGGRIAAVRLTGSSGSAELDRAVLAAVRNLSSFPPMPDGMPGNSFSFSVALKPR